MIEIGAYDDNEYIDVHVDYQIIINYKIVHISESLVAWEVTGCDGDEGLLSAFSV